MIDYDRLYNTFSSAGLLAIDIETKDNDLIAMGPGTHRDGNFICGLGIGSVHDRCYLSFTHPDTPCEVREKNRKFADSVLRLPIDKLGANIAYDIEWLNKEGFEVNGRYNDVQYAEPLLNENKRKYSLDSLAISYGVGKKKTSVLEKYNKTMGWKGKAIENIWRMPSNVAEEYALEDLTLPLEIFKRQKSLLERSNLVDLYNLEIDLIPVLLRMRRNGARIDKQQYMKTVSLVSDIKFELESKLRKWAGRDINFGSTAQLAEVFDCYKIPYPRNEPTKNMLEKGRTVGNPCLNKAVLHRLKEKYPICGDILNFRHYNTMINMFLHPWSNMLTKGYLYSTFHPLRSDKYGTVSGRFSCSNPNLQQVSSGSEDDYGFEELTGKILRRLFIPEEDYRWWGKLDYSQVEYRVMAHYAVGKGSDELKASYNEDKNMDYHQRIMDLTGFNRKIAKNVNFGGAYGIGRDTASSLFGWTLDEADEFLGTYHRNAPYIKETRSQVSQTVARRGYLFTLLGRRARLHSSRTLHSFFNRLIQGSSADIMKKSMVDAEKKGLFDVLKLHLTVHDELDVSVPGTREGIEALKELQNIMENTVKLSVPLKVDCEIGNNWGELNDVVWDDLYKEVA